MLFELLLPKLQHDLKVMHLEQPSGLHAQDQHEDALRYPVRLG